MQPKHARDIPGLLVYLGNEVHECWLQQLQVLHPGLLSHQVPDIDFIRAVLLIDLKLTRMDEAVNLGDRNPGNPGCLGDADILY